LLAASAARAARAQDQFEIQVYDAETAPRDDVGMETHLNFVASGTTVRSSAGELATDHVTHLTFEPHVGLAWWCEAGAYFQTAVLGDGTFQYAGVKLRFKARTRRVWRDRVGFALNVELSSVPRVFEATGLGAELRPIVDLRFKRLYASFNPIFDFDFFGAARGWPQFQPALAVEVTVFGPVALGAEFYGAYGPLNAFGRDSVNRLFGVIDLVFKRWAVQAGAGYGFTGGERAIVKAIVGIDFARD
jgi:hypothetical protein